jgi:predicted Zn-dependent protease
MRFDKGGRTEEARAASAQPAFVHPASSLLVLVLLGAACTPPSGARIGGILPQRISEGQELRAGQRASREAARTLGLVADQALQDYVQQVGAKVAAESERPQLSWTFRVLDDPMPNAFGMPGGYVFVTRGIMGVISSENELAGVLAHEIGHVNARHGVQALVRQGGPHLGVWGVPVPELRVLDGGSLTGVGFLFVGHSAEEERQADESGYRYTLAAGYDVRELPDVFLALGRLEAMGGRSALPAWRATHPDPGGRVEIAARRAAAAGEPPDSLRTNRYEYLDQIEDLAYGPDPRRGFFRGAVFIHPELRFRLDLPAGWRYRNLAQTVVATSPEGDAALQLTIVEQAGPDEAAERFLRQPGVDPTAGVAADTLRGNRTVAAPFRAVAGSTVATGVAAWISYAGRTYQIVGIAAGQASNGQSEGFRHAMRSFAPLTDPRLIDVRPNRLNIVRLGRATTFEEFSRRYPSVVDAEEVALLNRISGPGSRLRPGARMKRVVKG